MVRLTLYSRPGCHLCDQMKATVLRLADAMPLQVEEIDISQDPGLEQRYGLDIPVLLVEGRLAAKYRVSAGDLRRIIEGRSCDGGG